MSVEIRPVHNRLARIIPVTKLSRFGTSRFELDLGLILVQLLESAIGDSDNPSKVLE